MKYIPFLCILLLALAGCTQSIDEIKNEETIGEGVNIKGEVTSSIKILGISGFTVEDSSGESIGVSSERLPAKGDTVRVKGTLVRDSLFGYYVDADEVTFS